MRKYINTALWYAIAAMVGGVFYREFTKLNGFTGRTTLAFVHTHLFLLGMLFLLICGLYASKLSTVPRLARSFWITYHIGVPLTAVMLFVRGITQVLNIPLTRAADAAISGIAGIGHILTGTGIILFFFCLRRSAD